MRRIRLDPDNEALKRTGLDLIGRGDWEGLAAFVDGLSAEAAYVTIRLIGASLPLDADIRPLIASGRPLERMLAGAILHARAGRVRGMGMAELVSDDQWELYIPTLAHAQELLFEASRLDPDRGLTAAFRLAAFVDSSDEEKDEAELALRAARDVPISGLSRLVTARAKKWGGSHEEMWAVVAHYSESQPPASLGLLAKAHYEQWLYYAVFEEDEEVARKAEGYFQSPSVMGELEEASLRVVAAPDDADPRSIVFADNCFAYTFWTAGGARKARPHLQRMGKYLDPTVWLIERPRLALNQARLSAWLPPI